MISCGVLQNPRRVARKYYAAAIDGTEYEASINEDAITTKSSTGYSVLQWTAFSKVIEGQNAIGLVDKTIMYVFPRRHSLHRNGTSSFTCSDSMCLFGMDRSEAFACTHRTSGQLL